jgi:hypothetical protein
VCSIPYFYSFGSLIGVDDLHNVRGLTKAASRSSHEAITGQGSAAGVSDRETSSCSRLYQCEGRTCHNQIAVIHLHCRRLGDAVVLVADCICFCRASNQQTAPVMKSASTNVQYALTVKRSRSNFGK